MAFNNMQQTGTATVAVLLLCLSYYSTAFTRHQAQHTPPADVGACVSACHRRGPACYQGEGTLSSSTCQQQRTFAFTFAARNDQYLGDAPERLFTSLAAIGQHLTHTPDLALEVEVIVVDWGSETSLWRNSHAARLHGGYPCPLRYLHVPQKIADSVANQALSEVHAYNLAARASCSHYLLRLDQDTLVGAEFIGLMQMAAFRARHLLDQVWWCGRRETPEADYPKLVANPAAVLHERGFTYELWGRKEYLDGYGAVGVMGFPRSLWAALGGYNEALTGRGHMEYELFKRMAALQPNVTVLNVHALVNNGFYHLYHQPTSGDTRPINTYPDTIDTKYNADWGMLQHLPTIMEKVVC